jgi:hypothetical protein
MTYRDVFDAVDRMLRDIRETDYPGASQLPFGGIPTVFGGDFQQTLPIGPQGSNTRASIVQSTLQFAYVWDSLIQILSLVENMRLRSINPANVSLARWLSQLCTDEAMEGLIPVLGCLLPNTGYKVDKFVDSTYPEDDLHRLANVADPITLSRSCRFFAERAILTTKNTDVDAFNESILPFLPTEEWSLKLSDSCDLGAGLNSEIDLREDLTPQYLRTLSPNGFPLSDIRVKKGAPVMLLRNIDPRNGL